MLRVGRKRALIYHDHKLHGKILATATTSKYLGVTITSDLPNKANRTLGFLKRNLKIRSTSIKNVAYKSLVRPSLEYACSVSDPCTQTNVDKLEKVQRKATRFVLNDYDYNSSVSEMLTKLRWDSLQARRQIQRLANFYKIHYGLVDMGAEFRMQRQQRTSRHVNTLAYEVPRSRTSYHMYSFLPRTRRNWNILPDTFVRSPNIEQFKDPAFGPRKTLVFTIICH